MNTLIKSNFNNAHESLPGGVLITGHDICHNLNKQLIPKPLRDHILKQAVITFKASHPDIAGIQLQDVFDFSFFDLLAAFNFEQYTDGHQHTFIKELKEQTHYYYSHSTKVQTQFHTLQSYVEALNYESFLELPPASRLQLALYTLMLFFADPNSTENLGPLIGR